MQEDETSLVVDATVRTCRLGPANQVTVRVCLNERGVFITGTAADGTAGACHAGEPLPLVGGHGEPILEVETPNSYANLPLTG